VTDPEQSQFEVQLRATRPAKLPADFWSRLLAAGPPRKARPGAAWPAPAAMGWLRVLRWLVPATGLTVVTLMVGRVFLSSNGPKPTPSAASLASPLSAASALKPDDVQIDQELVSSFDTLARLPSGEPVRYRCRQWLDQVTLRDKAHGVIFKESTPRVEVVTVGFETY